MSQRNALVLISGRFYEMPVGDTLAGVLNTGQTGQFASANALTATGAYLLSQIAASSAGVTSLNGGSGALLLTGAGNISLTAAGQLLTISGNTGDYALFAPKTDLTASGHALYVYIQQTSGAIPTIQVTGSQPIGTLNLTGMGGTLVIYSGGYVLISGAAGGGGGGDVTFAQLTATGAEINARITALSGYSDAIFATKIALANTGQLAWQAADANGRNISGVLTQTGVQLGASLQTTGQNLYALLTGGSGQGVTDYATKAGLATTGQQAWQAADANARNLSGNLTQSGVQLGARIDTVTASLATTGQNLYALVTGLSGEVVADYATKLSLATTGQQSWTAADNNARALSGALSQTGATLLSLISASSAGVASLNGASGVLTLAGAGTVVVTTAGQTITASGNSVDATALSGKLATTGQQL